MAQTWRATGFLCLPQECVVLLDLRRGEIVARGVLDVREMAVQPDQLGVRMSGHGFEHPCQTRGIGTLSPGAGFHFQVDARGRGFGSGDFENRPQTGGFTQGQVDAGPQGNGHSLGFDRPELEDFHVQTKIVHPIRFVRRMHAEPVRAGRSEGSRGDFETMTIAIALDDRGEQDVGTNQLTKHPDIRTKRGRIDLDPLQAHDWPFPVVASGSPNRS